MQEAESEQKLYKYKRTFTMATDDRPPAQMDKDALTAYIREVLGMTGSSPETRIPEGADSTAK